MKHRRIACVALALAMLMVGVGRAEAATIVTAAHDASIRNDLPANNNGSGNVLESATKLGTPSTEIRRVVTSFDLSFLTSDPAVTTVTSATLQLGVPTLAFGSHSGQSLQRLLVDFVETEVNWTEYASGSSWATAGGLGATDSENIATGVYTGDGSTAWANGGLDVTAVVNAWLASPDTTQLGFLMHETSANPALHHYGSAESTNGPGPGPVLIIDVPEPASAALLGLTGVGLMFRRRTRTRSA